MKRILTTSIFRLVALGAPVGLVAAFLGGGTWH